MRGSRALLRWTVASLPVAFVGLNAALLACGGVRLGGDSNRVPWHPPVRRPPPGPSLRLAVRRVAVEFAHVRPHYSWRHNAVIGATLLPLYALAAAGLAATWRHPLTHLLLSLIGAHLLLVAATLADYDGRFLLYPLLGSLAALAGAGFSTLARPHALATVAAGPATRSS